MDTLSYLLGKKAGGGGSSKGLKVEVVEELPQIGEANILYLVPKENEEDNDIFDEWLYIENDWEHIGSTDIDLSNYYDKDEVDSLLSDKADIDDIPTKTSDLLNDSGFLDSIPQEILTKLDFTNVAYASSNTGTSTAAKVATSSNTSWERKDGSIVIVRYHNSTGNPTWNTVTSGLSLNVNNTGSASIVDPNYVSGTPAQKDYYASVLCIYIYYGNKYRFIYSYAKPNDLVAKGYAFADCSTAENVLEKTFFADYVQTTGGLLNIYFTNAVKANSTLKPYGYTASPIYYQGQPIVDGIIPAGSYVIFMLHNGVYNVISVDKNQALATKDYVDNIVGNINTILATLTIPNSNVSL